MPSRRHSRNRSSSSSRSYDPESNRHSRHHRHHHSLNSSSEGSRRSYHRSFHRSSSSDRSLTPKRRRRSDGSALRKSVLRKEARKAQLARSIENAQKFLKINHKPEDLMSPSKTNFELNGRQKVRVKRSVTVEEDSIKLFTTVYIFHDSLSENSAAYARAMEADASTEMNYRPEDKNPMERCGQTMFYGEKMIRIARDVTIRRDYWNQAWDAEDASKTEDFISVTADRRAFDSSVELKSRSKNGRSGYRNATAFIINFTGEENDESMCLAMVRSALKQRKERPNLEELIHMAETLEHDGKRLIMLDEAHLLSDLTRMEVGSYVEEIREYHFEPAGNVIGMLSPIDKKWRMNSFRQMEDGSSSFIQMPTSNSQSTLKNRSRSRSATRSSFHTPTRTSSINRSRSPSMSRDSFYTAMDEESQSEGFYRTTDENQYSPTFVPANRSVHPIAIPGPQAFRQGHRAHTMIASESNREMKLKEKARNRSCIENLQSYSTARSRNRSSDARFDISSETTVNPAMNTAIWPEEERNSSKVKAAIETRQGKARSADVDLNRIDQGQPTLNLEVSKTPEGEIRHRHTLLLVAEIEGKSYEFTGNIHFIGAPGAAFAPKRVLVDDKLLWEQSNEWNPTSIMDSQINMTLNKSCHNQTKK